MNAFTGGSKLQARLAEMTRKLSRPATLAVGFLEGATYPDGTPVPVVAAANEFGTAKSPPRAFFRGMISDKSPGWGDAVAKTLEATDYDVTAAMELMGQGIEGQLKQAIIDFDSVPLAASTVARKGFDKQLVDSSHMLNSTGHEVVPSEP